MLVLIDESGDTGFKQGSSRYFVMAMVVFETHDGNGRYPDAEHTARVIQQVQEETGHKPEFHFSQCSHRVRRAFFQKLNRENCVFDLYVMVIDKQKIYSPHLKKNTKNFYNFILKQLLAHNPVSSAKVKIDGDKSKAFRQTLKTYLRKGQDGMVNTLKFSNSKNDFLIQLADMCCSAVAYRYSRQDRLESDIYMNMLEDRLIDVWEFE